MGPGDVVAERFELEALAGRGGMGAVFRARDRTDGEPCAIKLLQASGSQDGDRFAREAVMLGELRHPGIVRYLAHGTTLAGERYLATEWLEGETLADRVSRQGLTIEETLALAGRCAEALAFLHRKGVVHRDVKPSNIFLLEGRLERVKLLDFGVARLVDRSQELTITGAMIGTPGYMAPEQARGEREIDARADVFSLGCVMYKCLTGHNAFAAEDVLGVLLRVVLEDAPRVRGDRHDVPEALDDLVARMLAKAPNDRPSDGEAVAAELGALGRIEGPRAEAARDSLPALTGTEQRVMSLVLCSALRSLREHDATLVTVDLERRTDEIRAVAEAHGGALETLANGSVLVSFAGAGSAADHAARAARCALAMREILPDPAIVVVSGRGVLAARMPIGEVIDRGVRLLELPEPDGVATSPGGSTRPVRLDALTAGLLDARFDVRSDDAGPALVGEREAGETRTLLGRPTPCVGRERELAGLLAVFEECHSEPVARAVLVTAPGGFGKSRLRYELLRRLRDAEEAPVVWVGRGDPMSVGSPFGMLAPALRRTAGILDGEAGDVRRKKLGARVARSVPAKDRARVTEFLGELCGIPPDREQSVQLRAARQDAMLMGDQMRRAWGDFVLAECAERPLLIVLEDLHWGDLPSVKLVDTALRTANDRPLMVLALARPEVHELFPRLWAERSVTQMNLSALTKKACERLIREVLRPEPSADTVARLLERAGGNALYLEELIRAVAEGKGDALPETVLAMLQARLDGLEAEARRVLRAASVFGQVFWRGGASALLGGARKTSQLDEWLGMLADQELITRRGVARFPGEQEYVFRHALLREAAYATLTDTDRRLGHRLGARWLEEAGEGDAMVMAEHLERGGEPGGAVSWYRSASVQALEGNDFEAAVQRADRAVWCGASPELAGALRLVQAEANRWRGEHAAAKNSATAAIANLPRGEAVWYAAIGEAVLAAGRLGDYDELALLVAELERGAHVDGVASGQELAATARAAFYLLVAGRHERASALLARIEQVDERVLASDPAAAARMHQARAVRAMYGADAGACLAEWVASVDRFLEAGDVRSACSQRANVGYSYVALGAGERAAEVLRQALAEAESMGLATVAALTRTNLGLALTVLGRFDEAAQEIERALEVWGVQGDPRMRGGALSYLARVRLARGDLDAAEREARQAVDVLGSTPPARAYALATLAEVLLARGRPSDAHAATEEAKELLVELGGIEEGDSLVRRVHAEALRASGRLDRALAEIRAAADHVRERAAKISDAAWRRSFLENVPDHARIFELAAAWTDEEARR